MAVRRALVALLAALLVTSTTGACTRSGGVDRADPTVPTAPPALAATTGTTGTTATGVPADPFATPAAVDAAYVERVLVELNRVYGDTARRIVETHRFERSDIDPLGAIFNPPLLEVQVDQFASILDLDRDLFKDPIGYRRMTVLEVVTAKPACIFAKVTIDVSAVLVSPPPAREKYVTLDPKPADADPSGANPTPWSMAGESSARQDPCVD